MVTPVYFNHSEGIMSSEYIPTSHSSRHLSRNTSHGAAASDANIRNFAPVARIMKTALPENAKIAKEAKECMQECVSEFISFITSEGKQLPQSLPPLHGDLELTFLSHSIRKMSAREAKDGERRRHLVCYDLARLRELCRSLEDLSVQISRSEYGLDPFPFSHMSFTQTNMNLNI